MRKFSFDTEGQAIPTSKAVSDGRHACVEYGINTVANTPYGHVFGYLLRLVEDKDAEIAAIKQEIATLKSAQPQAALVDVQAEYNPDGTKKSYRNMTAEERASYRKTKGA
jgi:hypothetical protein